MAALTLTAWIESKLITSYCVTKVVDIVYHIHVRAYRQLLDNIWNVVESLPGRWYLVRRRARKQSWRGKSRVSQGGGFGYGGQGLGLPATKFSHQWSIGDCKLVVR